MIYRIVFYQSICEKLKDGVCFHANWEGKGALIFLIFRHRWTNPPRRTQPLRLCFFARHNIFFLNYFINPLYSGFFLFSR